MTMMVYHVTTTKKVKRYIASGGILPPVRFWGNEHCARPNEECSPHKVRKLSGAVETHCSLCFKLLDPMSETRRPGGNND